MTYTNPFDKIANMMTKDLLYELIDTIKAAKEFIEETQDYLPNTPDGSTQNIILRCEKAIEAAQANQQDKPEASCQRLQ